MAVLPFRDLQRYAGLARVEWRLWPFLAGAVLGSAGVRYWLLYLLSFSAAKS